jgi:hypothetical protein
MIVGGGVSACRRLPASARCHRPAASSISVYEPACPAARSRAPSSLASPGEGRLARVGQATLVLAASPGASAPGSRKATRDDPAQDARVVQIFASAPPAKWNVTESWPPLGRRLVK